ncbi:MAG: hypothetical protein MJ053_07595 [Elusimicrobiaceae bacterium]|nr:hypothetical protein [Elusimicrobiaceae bacterium]
MMKKLVFILWVSLSVCPVFAQESKLIKAGADAAHNSVAGQVSWQVARQLKAAHMFNNSLARIVNMSGAPLVQVRLAQNAADPQDILSARLLKPAELYNYTNLDNSGELNSPRPFAQAQGSAFRGISVRDLVALRHLFRNGMEIKKSEFPEIYSSHKLDVALGYIYPAEEDIVLEESADGHFELPVVARIPFTQQLLKQNPPEVSISQEIVFSQDIKPQFISEVMVVLEINGQVGWYQTIVENGQLLLLPVPSARIAQSSDFW